MIANDFYFHRGGFFSWGSRGSHSALLTVVRSSSSRRFRVSGEPSTSTTPHTPTTSSDVTSCQGKHWHTALSPITRTLWYPNPNPDQLLINFTFSTFICLQWTTSILDFPVYSFKMWLNKIAEWNKGLFCYCVCVSDKYNNSKVELPQWWKYLWNAPASHIGTGWSLDGTLWCVPPLGADPRLQLPSKGSV